jgi:hypothetical protein
MQHALVRPPEQAVTLPVVTLREGKDFLVAAMRGDSARLGS